MKAKIKAVAIIGAALLGVFLLVVAILRPAWAETLPTSEITIKVMGSPVYVEPTRKVYSIGTAQTQLIQDCSTAYKSIIQRLLITNTSTANNLCVYMVAAGASCGASITCNITPGQTVGDLVMPMSVKEWPIPCSMRLCGVASATSTVVHVSRAEVP